MKNSKNIVTEELELLRKRVAELEILEKEIKEVKKTLDKRERLIEAVADAINCIVEGNYEYHSIQKAMEILCVAANADRVSIFEYHKNLQTGERLISQRYEWAIDDVEAQIDNPDLQNVEVDNIFPGWFDRNEEGNPTNEIVKNLSPSIRAILEPQNILSILIVPIIINGKLWGSIGFDDCHRERLWDDSEVRFLFAVAGTIGVAIVKQKAEEEKKKIEEQLIQSQKMEAIGTLAGGIAHDFNNILAAINGYTELCLHNLHNGEQIDKYLLHILKGTNRAKKLVEYILTFSRQKETSRKPCDLNILIKEAIKFFKAVIPRNVKIFYRTVIDSAVVFAEPTEIYQILLNLSTNASYAIGARGGEVMINLEEVIIDEKSLPLYRNIQKGKFFSLKVKDNGSGIKQDILNRIFEPFFTTKEAGEGTGLGLSVVYGVVKSLNGDIIAVSEAGEGSLFEVLLPALDENCISEVEEKNEILTGNERILFIDDEDELVAMEKKRLVTIGYKVKGKHDSNKALKLFEKNPYDFDVVITDYTMPDMNGLELAEHILAIRPDIPVILCTGYSKNINKEKAYKIGIKEILTKPVELHEIAQAIRKALKK